jgi:hypothetical protein
MMQDKGDRLETVPRNGAERTKTVILRSGRRGGRDDKAPKVWNAGTAGEPRQGANPQEA